MFSAAPKEWNLFRHERIFAGSRSIWQTCLSTDLSINQWYYSFIHSFILSFFHSFILSFAQSAIFLTVLLGIHYSGLAVPGFGDDRSNVHRRTTVTIDQQLTTDRLVRFQRQFQEADTDRGGNISMDEFRAALKRTIGNHVTDEEADMIFMKVLTQSIFC